MKKYRLLIAAIVLSTTTPLVSGCAALTAVGTATQIADYIGGPVEIPLEVRKAYMVFRAGAVGANQMAEVAVDSGLLKPGSPRAIWVADRLKELDVLVRAAEVAYHAKDTDTLQEKIAAGETIIAIVSPLVAR